MYSFLTLLDTTSRSQGKVVVRKGTADDYEGVLDMDPNHTIYKGNDYLPAEYFRFLNDPDRTITVYLLDGKIVSLTRFLVNGRNSYMSCCCCSINCSFRVMHSQKSL